MIKKYFLGGTLILIFFILFSIPYYDNYFLKKNKLLISGTIIKFESGGGKNSVVDYINYKYNYNSKEYNDIKTKTVNGKIFLGQNFPVIINKKKPSSSKMLILPIDFEEYGYSFPDSLKWVLKYKNGVIRF
jgi:hypothetical protein